VVVAETVGEYVVPVANTVPPVAAVYQFTEASGTISTAAAAKASVGPVLPGVAVRVTVPLPQRLAWDTVGGSGKIFTVAVTAVRAALSHVPERVEA